MWPYTLTTEISTEPRYKIGDKLYLVEPSYTKEKYAVFTGVCPCCNDTKWLTVNGIKIPCSYCAQNSKTSNTTIIIKNWEVHEYIVHEMRIVGPYTKKSYENNGKTKKYHNDYPYVRDIVAFHKYGKGYGEIEKRDVTLVIPLNDTTIERNLEEYPKATPYGQWFKAKDEAAKYLKKLKTLDKTRLQEFNKINGTSHTYPY